MYQSIVLAAGYSKRANRNKLILEINHEPVVMHLVKTLLEVCQEVVVVTGHYRDDIDNLFKEMERVILVYNENYHLGMFSSIMCALPYIRHDCFIIPGDYPIIQLKTLKKLCCEDGLIVVPEYKGRKGHPILLRETMINSLKKEPLNSNLRAFRDRYETRYTPVDDIGVIKDIDTIEDYIQVLGLTNQKVKLSIKDCEEERA